MKDREGLFEALHGGQADLTRVQRRRLESSIDIYESPVERIVYQHTVLCQTVLPYQNPGDQVRRWERQQGAVWMPGATQSESKTAGAGAVDFFEFTPVRFRFGKIFEGLREPGVIREDEPPPSHS